MPYLFNGANWDLNVDTSIPNLLFQHLYITGVSLFIALLIAFPVALLASRYQRLYAPVISLAGFLYTLPSFAVVGILVIYTGLNPPTVIIPLVAYAQVVLIRNISAAINSVDPSLVDVGRAMGMNRTQLMLRVILPLALPVIVAGVRIAAVTSIGIATIGPFVGVSDLGTLIFNGLSFVSQNEEIAGAILITALALLTDFVLLGLQRWLSRGRPIGVAA